MTSPPQAGPGIPDRISPENPPDVVVVVILGVFLGPIAYFVNGQWQKGVVGILIYLGLLLFSLVTCGLGSILFFPAHLFAILDSYFQTKHLRDGFPISQWTFFTSHL